MFKPFIFISNITENALTLSEQILMEHKWYIETDT